MVRRLWCLYLPHFHQVTSLATFSMFLVIQGWRFHVWHIHHYGLHAVLAVVLAITSPTGGAEAEQLQGSWHQRVNADMPLAVRRAHGAGIDAVITTRRRGRRPVFGIQADRVYVVGNGVDTEIFHPRSDEHSVSKATEVDADGMVVFVGACPRKIMVCYVWQLALPNLTAWKLVLVGDGPVRAELEPLSRKHGYGIVTVCKPMWNLAARMLCSAS
jgi:glycosyltransferase involved in cell wall biosynthesis